MKTNARIRHSVFILIAALLLAAYLCSGVAIFADPEDETYRPDPEAQTGAEDPAPGVGAPVTDSAAEDETPVTGAIGGAEPSTDKNAGSDIPVSDVTTEPRPVNTTAQTTKAQTTTTANTTWHIQKNPPVSQTEPSLSPAIVPITDAPTKDPVVSDQPAKTVDNITESVTTTANPVTVVEPAAVITTGGLIAAGAILSLLALLAIIFTLLFNKTA